MDRLTFLDAGLRALDTRLPDVTPSLCVVTRYRGGSCRRCLDVCPGSAITCVDWLAVAPDLCSSCGACAAVCRTGALTFVGRSAALRDCLAPAAAADEPAVALVCRPAEPAYTAAGATLRAVVVPCLGGVGAADLVAAVALGTTTVELVAGRCEDCPQAAAGACVTAALEAAQATLAALGAGGTFSRRAVDGAAGRDDRDPDDTPADGPGGRDAAADGAAMSRQELFSFLARGVRRTVAEATSTERHTIEELHRQAPPPSGHARLLDDLAALRASGPSGAITLPVELPFAAVAVGAACDGCGLCVRYCPHAALTIQDGRAVWSAATCTACGLCAEVCPPGALGVGPAVVAAAPS